MRGRMDGGAERIEGMEGGGWGDGGMGEKYGARWEVRGGAAAALRPTLGSGLPEELQPALGRPSRRNMVAFRRCPRKLRAVLRTCRAAEHVPVSRGWPVGAEMAEIGQGRARRPERPFGGILPVLPMRRPNNRPPRAHEATRNLFDPCEHPPAGISLHGFSVKRSRVARPLT